MEKVIDQNSKAFVSIDRDQLEIILRKIDFILEEINKEQNLPKRNEIK